MRRPSVSPAATTPRRESAAVTSQHHTPGGMVSGGLLNVPQGRQRGSSLPGNIEVVNQEDIYRLRNFSLAGKKVINRGDSLKAARSSHSINSTGSRQVNQIKDGDNNNNGSKVVFRPWGESTCWRVKSNFLYSCMHSTF